MIDKSFQIIRTTPSLTTNVKLVVSSDYNMYLESFNSTKDLSNDKYKHFKLSKESLLEDKFPLFYKGIPSNTAFAVKYDDDINISYRDYNNQMDDIYFGGAKYIEDQWYSEEFEYLAPLYIKKNNLPKAFIILRVDDGAIYKNNNNSSFDISNIDKDNFKEEIVDKWKCIKIFDMSYQSNIGYFLYNNIDNNKRFPKSPLDISFNKDVMSKWSGLDYKTGVYTEKYSFLDNHLFYDNPQFLFEKYITDGYKRNEIIYPNIINFKFLYDDTPATPYEFKKYSMNRYFGFYVDDMEYIRSLTSYVTPDIKSNVELLNNIFISGGTYVTEWNNDISDYDIEPLSVNPFVEDWDNGKNYNVYINKTLYSVIKVYENNKYYYKVVTNEILDTYWNSGTTNLYTVNIGFDGDYNFINPVSSDFKIDPYYYCSGLTEKVMYGDLYLIDINGEFHVLKNGSGITYSEKDIYNTNKLIDKYYIQSDYAINSNSSILEYWKGGDNSGYYVNKSTTGNTIKESPITYPIYRVKFSDIKDFDFDKVNTKFSNFNYEKDEYVYTDEPKLYATEYRDKSVNIEYKVGRKGDSDQYKISNVSSEYISSDEIFEIKENNLSDIWKKNPIFCKWGVAGSISNGDYPYKLNISTISSDAFNRTTDVYTDTPIQQNKNLGYFYRIGNFYSGTTGNTFYFLNQFENIQPDFINENDVNFGQGFNLKKYFESDVDYFEFYFKNKMYYKENNIIYTKNYLKYSVFNNGGNFNPSETVFKGLKYKIFKISDVITTDDVIDNIIIDNTTSYNDYKISVILNDIYVTGGTYVMNGVVDENNVLPKNKNGIHIMINEKFKNILIILNVMIPMYPEYNSFYNLSYFNPDIGLYKTQTKNGDEISDNVGNKYNPYTITASKYISALNDLNYKYFGRLTTVTGGDIYSDYVKYYYIKEYDSVIYTGNTYMNDFTYSTMSNIKGWRKVYPPIMINVELPNTLSIIKNYYTQSSIDGPRKQGPTFSLNNYDVNEPLARKINNKLSLNSGNNEYVKLFRYGGSYEPIFNDIILFNTSDFCYEIEYFYSGETFVTNITKASLATEEYADNENNPYDTSLGNDSEELAIIIENNLKWYNLNGICKKKNDAPYVNISNETVIEGLNKINSNILTTRFYFNIPEDAVIKGIMIYNKLKTNYDEKLDGGEAKVYTMDKMARLRTNYHMTGSGDDHSQGITYPASDDFQQYEYGGPTDLWDLIGVTPSEINDGLDFLYRVEMTKDRETEFNFTTNVTCVTAQVYYELNYTGYTVSNSHFIGSNYKFDTDLNGFGDIQEFVYSKVNPSTEILKFDNKNQKNMYPMLDQYGYSYSKRFIFKSNWDKDYYYKTENDFE